MTIKRSSSEISERKQLRLHTSTKYNLACADVWCCNENFLSQWMFLWCKEITANLQNDSCMLTLKQFVSNDLLNMDVLALSTREFLIITIDKSGNYQVILLENILWAVWYMYCRFLSSHKARVAPVADWIIIMMTMIIMMTIVCNKYNFMSPVYKNSSAWNTSHQFFTRWYTDRYNCSWSRACQMLLYCLAF